MKKSSFLTSLVLACCLSTVAFAQNSGGYTGPALSQITVKEAKKLSDDKPVVLVGKIEKGLGGEKYLFKDATDSVTIEIDDDKWRGLTVGPEDLIEIRGEVDKDFTSFKIDVDSVVKK